MQINEYIEHTNLNPFATFCDIEKLINEAKEYKFYGVCVNPCNIKWAKEKIGSGDISLVTVIGFPLGANTTKTKVFEAQMALDNGADELDMVINIGFLKSKLYTDVFNEIYSIRSLANDFILKVIIETDYLSENEIVEMCKICIDANVDFVKTSTGFAKNGIGATENNVKLMYDIVSKYGIKVKASGGIKTKEQAFKLIKCGANRLGTSSSINIVKNNN